ncbi:MAG: hypothetical protein H0U95_04415 [Bacteroidetes bacterium]|nr:hypothetical protein [Bacteroidota bacterium]
MKTKTINILSLLAGEVLKRCKEKNIVCTYLGQDDKNRLRMQLDYLQEDEPIITELEQHILKQRKDLHQLVQALEALEKENIKLRVSLAISEMARNIMYI